MRLLPYVSHTCVKMAAFMSVTCLFRRMVTVCFLCCCIAQCSKVQNRVASSFLPALLRVLAEGGFPFLLFGFPIAHRFSRASPFVALPSAMSLFDDPDFDIGDMVEQEEGACDFFHDHMGQHDSGGPPDDFWVAVEEHQVSGHDESQQGEAATHAAVRSDEAGSNLEDDAIVIENQPISDYVSAQVDVNERNRMLHGDSVSAAATPIVGAHMESPRTPSSASAMEAGSSTSHGWHAVSLPVSSSGASRESIGSGSSTSNAESMQNKKNEGFGAKQGMEAINEIPCEQLN